MPASIKDIAKSLGISVSTVSLALNDKPRVSKEMREKVKQKAKELNYVKNGSALDLQRKRTNIILFIVNDASRSFFSAIINQLQTATVNFGYDFIICTTYGNHLDTAKRFMEEHRADAAIIYTGTIPDEMIQSCASEDFPIVVLGRHIEGEHIYSLFYGILPESPITQYLIDLGHRKIAFVKGSSASLNTSRSLKQYKATLEKNHLPFDETLVFDAMGSSYKKGYAITEKLIDRIEEIDAIQYSTDDIAIGGILCLKDHHIQIPQQVSVIGHNNIAESAFISPGLTTYGDTADQYLYYEAIIHYLITMIEKEENYQEISSQLAERLQHFDSKPELIIRESTAECTKYK
ncbi:MAG: LacI family DNA-binding transcriptional regulator [Bulleidia sp.]|nr:LacI family DNA-binding transcriptional regulator [Bulleidia sp.]